MPITKAKMPVGIIARIFPIEDDKNPKTRKKIKSNILIFFGSKIVSVPGKFSAGFPQSDSC